jgi:hypothetical protein
MGQVYSVVACSEDVERGALGTSEGCVNRIGLARKSSRHFSLQK